MIVDILNQYVQTELVNFPGLLAQSPLNAKSMYETTMATFTESVMLPQLCLMSVDVLLLIHCHSQANQENITVRMYKSTCIYLSIFPYRDFLTPGSHIPDCGQNFNHYI